MGAMLWSMQLIAEGANRRLGSDGVYVPGRTLRGVRRLVCELLITVNDVNPSG